jgi:hypothetical protein
MSLREAERRQRQRAQSHRTSQRILTFKAWIELNGISESTGRRLIRAGKVRITRLSERRKGNVIDTAVVIPSLTEVEQARVDQLKSAERERLKPTAAKARKAWAKEFAAKHGMSEQEAERIATQASNYILEPEFELEFDDLGTCTVAEVISNPDRYIGQSLADPVEGISYGRDKAMVLRQRDGCLMIHSFAHGGIDYALAGQAPSGKFYGKCALFFEAFWTDDAIEQQFRNHPERYAEISVARYLEGERLRAQIEDCRAHWLGKWGVTLKDFYTFLPKGDRYIFIPTGDLWPGSSVDVRLPPVPLFEVDGSPILNKDNKQIVLAPSEWLAQNRRVDQMTWAPGEPMLIEGKLMTESGWVERDGVSCFNLYRPPKLDGGDAGKAGAWLDHIDEIYPNDVGHIVAWCAHRVQRPGDKINHALLLIGEQGVGKDSLLEPVRRAMGAGNAHDIRPKDLFAPQNEFVQSTLLTINEVHDLGEVSRFDFYDGMKIYTAAPPDTLRVNVKYVPQYYVPNVCGVVMTSNHKAGGVYLPPDDRRTYAASSDRSKEDFAEAYWNKLWGYYEQGGGFAHVAAYLQAYDLSGFNAKAPPPRTATWWSIVDSNRAPEEGELADVLDKLGNPHAVTLLQIIRMAKSGRTVLVDFYEWITDRKNRRQVPHRMEKCGYVPVRNDAAEDGLWKIEGKRQAVYARKNLSHMLQIRAARKLAGGQ